MSYTVIQDAERERQEHTLAEIEADTRLWNARELDRYRARKAREREQQQHVARALRGEGGE